MPTFPAKGEVLWDGRFRMRFGARRIGEVRCLGAEGWRQATSSEDSRSRSFQRGSTGSPSLAISLNPIVIPVVLIAVGSVVRYMTDGGALPSSAATEIIQVLGDKNIALAIGVVFAFALTKYCPQGKRASNGRES